MSFLTLVTQTSPNTSLGFGSLVNVIVPNATGNVAIGPGAGAQITTGDSNTALGENALILNQTGNQNTAVGGSAMSGSVNATDNVAVGYQALSQIGGNANTAIGAYAGSAISTGAKNSILGGYTGNQGGLDIRTLSNYIVLSDGDGNPRLWIDNTGAMSVPGGGSISGSLTITGGTVTASNPVLQATQTWNNAAVTFTGWRLNVTDTASAADSLLMDLQTGGTSLFRVTKDGLLRLPFGTGIPNTGGSPGIQLLSGANVWGAIFAHNGGSSGGGICLSPYGSLSTFLNVGASQVSIGASMPFGWASSSGNVQVGLAVALWQESGTLAQRNGTTAQTFRIYNTFTDSSNYERAAFSWSGGQFNIATEAAGTGTGRNLSIVSAATLFMSSPSSEIYFQTGGVSRWRVSNGGTFFPHQDNAVDIGFSGNRPRAGWFGSELMVGGTISAGSETIDVLSGTKAPQFAASTQTNNGFAAVVAAVRDGANNRRAGIYVDDSDATWGLASKYSSGGADFVLVNNAQRMITATTSYNVIIGFGAIATTAADGFFYIPSCAGTPTGAPTAYTGRVPLVVDTTNNKLYFYSGGAWRDAGP